MSGKRQHYIPRFLLRRFADDRDQIAALRLSGPAFLSSTANIALEKDFFGPAGPGTADESISAEENQVVGLLDEINRILPGHVQTLAAAKLVAHFSTRTRSLRSFIHQAADMTLQKIEVQLSDAGFVRQMLADQLRSEAGLLKDEFDKTFVAQHGARAHKRFARTPGYARSLAALNTQAKQKVAELAPESWKGVTTGLQQLRSKAATLASDAHAKVALQSPTPQARVDFLSKFRFTVGDHEPNSLVLGDSVAWGVRYGGNALPLSILSEDIETIFMPVSNARILIGWREHPPDSDCGDLRRLAAATSEHFVVGHPSTDGLADLQPILGTAFRSVLMQSVDGISFDS